MPADSALQNANLAEEYILLAVLGERPQILTELIWSLAQHGAFPKRIIVLTTARGERILRGQLLGCDSHHNIKNWGNRWTPFCNQVLDSDPLDLEIKVPREDGTKIEDIYEPRDGRLFENWCFDLVHSLTRDMDAPRLYGCVAGGRKTMAQDLTTAFTLYARSGDRLFHVIVSKHIEEDVPEFFWPRADRDHSEYADEMHRVNKSFPHLRARLEDGLLSEISGVDGRSHYQELLDALAPDRRALATPKSVTLRIQLKRSSAERNNSDSTLTVFDATGECLAEVRLTLKPLITLLFLWDQIWDRGERKYVSREALKTEDVDRKRKKLYKIFYGREPVISRKANESDWVRWSPQSHSNPCSSAVSHLKTEVMKKEPPLERYFLVSGRPKPPDVDKNEPVYAFPGPLPKDIKLNIEVVPDEREQLLQLEEYWPFDNLPQPEVVDD